MSDSENQWAKWRASQYGIRWQVLTGRVTAAGYFDRREDAESHADYLNTLEATITTLKAQLTAAEGSMREIVRVAKTVDSSRGTSPMIERVATMVGVAQRWLALSAPASDTHANWTPYGGDPNCEHDWHPIKSTKDACIKCKAQRKVFTSASDTGSEEGQLCDRFGHVFDIGSERCRCGEMGVVGGAR